MSRLWLLVLLLNWIDSILAIQDARCSDADMANCVVNLKPWLTIAANSEQVQPIFLGKSPREIALGPGKHLSGRPIPPDPLPGRLNTTATQQLPELRNALLLRESISKSDTVYFEAWPSYDQDNGWYTWSYARYTKDFSQPRSAWEWMDDSLFNNMTELPEDPFLPGAYLPWKNKQFHQLFDDFLQMNDLYQKPLFGDCIWTNYTRTTGPPPVLAAWIDPDQRQHFADQVQAGQWPDVMCRHLPQPAFVDGVPFTWVLSATPDAVPLSLPSRASQIEKARAEEAKAAEQLGAELLRTRKCDKSKLRRKLHTPHDFEQDYQNDVMILSGAADAIFPVTNRTMRFTKKNSATVDNELPLMVQYLEERYAMLGISTFRIDFTWRNISQTNLVAVIPGSNPESRPVVMADHFDTAFEEDEFAKSGNRVSAPGADDNDSATAALLAAARILVRAQPDIDIWLLHLTGEEYPGDDLGVRHFLTKMLGWKQDLEGIVLMDMIGWRNQTIDDRVFQVNAGDSPSSLAMASIALQVAPIIAPDFTPVLRTRFDPYSYLYNTDGIVFSDIGFPVILFNEHINGLENIDRDGYHTSTDTWKLMDFHYAASIARLAIETAWAMANSWCL